MVISINRDAAAASLAEVVMSLFLPDYLPDD
jgi:hypothetical protein